MSDMSGKNRNGYRLAFVLVTSLFFLWAIAHNMNDILIKQFQKALDLSRGQAGFIQFSFYLAYLFAALPAGLAMKKYGYKRTIIIGLVTYALGAMLFYPAAEVRSYPFFLASLFIVASGIVFLETSGSGYITLVGDPDKSVQRINFSQSFNGVGAVLAPLVGGIFIFSGVEYTPEQLQALSPEAIDSYRAFEAKQVQLPYLSIAAIVLLIAVCVFVAKFPPYKRTQDENAEASSRFADVWKIKSFKTGVVAQFFYVGAQIAGWSYFIDFVKDLSPATSERMAAYLLSGSLFAFMVGRFFGTYLLTKLTPRRLLGYYAAIAFILAAIAVVGDGWVAIIALFTTSFFMSIMFPTIYGLALEKLGEHAQVGSSIIIMTIISGAIIPPILGYLSDIIGVQSAYVVLLICYAMVWVATKLGAEADHG